jgi:hypothetical protein
MRRKARKMGMVLKFMMLRGIGVVGVKLKGLFLGYCSGKIDR